MTPTTSAQQTITVAERLLDTERVLAAAPDRAGASLQSLAGTALLHARLAAVDPVFAAAAHTHWTAAATHTPRQHAARPGVFAAPGGLAASLILGQHYLPDPTPQQRAVQQTVKWLSAQAVRQASAHHERLQRDEGAAASWALYDAITGLSGTGRILLAALADGHTDAEPGIIAALSALSKMINSPNSGTRPGWWIPTSNPTAHPPASGRAETGIAHGIAGPLALLSIAASAGWAVDGQTSAIHTAAHWLLTWQTPDTQTWPPYITGTELDTHQPSPAPGRRDAWCYGTPGISRALILSGHALADNEIQHAGQQALAALTSRPPHAWDVEGPSICHGLAGVLQCARHDSPDLADQAAAALMTHFDPRHRYGFQHLHHGTPANEPGLLTGTAGIALALADHGNLPAPATPCTWDSVLLISLGRSCGIPSRVLRSKRALGTGGLPWPRIPI